VRASHGGRLANGSAPAVAGPWHRSGGHGARRRRRAAPAARRRPGRRGARSAAALRRGRDGAPRAAAAPRVWRAGPPWVGCVGAAGCKQSGRRLRPRRGNPIAGGQGRAPARPLRPPRLTTLLRLPLPPPRPPGRRPAPRRRPTGARAAAARATAPRRARVAAAAAATARPQACLPSPPPRAARSAPAPAAAPAPARRRWVRRRRPRGAARGWTPSTPRSSRSPCPCCEARLFGGGGCGKAGSGPSRAPRAGAGAARRAALPGASRSSAASRSGAKRPRRPRQPLTSRAPAPPPRHRSATLAAEPVAALVDTAYVGGSGTPGGRRAAGGGWRPAQQRRPCGGVWRLPPPARGHGGSTSPLARTRSRPRAPPKPAPARPPRRGAARRRRRRAVGVRPWALGGAGPDRCCPSPTPRAAAGARAPVSAQRRQPLCPCNSLCSQVYNTVTKLVQIPLLSIATTTVAAAKGAEAAQQAASAAGGGAQEAGGAQQPGGAQQQQAPGGGVSAAASSALAVALGVGLVVAAGLAAGGPALARVWGAGPASPLRGPALDFLTVRALGAPVSILLLVTQVTPRAVALVTGRRRRRPAPCCRGRPHPAADARPPACPSHRAPPAGLLSRPAGHAHPLLCHAGRQHAQHRCGAAKAAGLGDCGAPALHAGLSNPTSRHHPLPTPTLTPKPQTPSPGVRPDLPGRPRRARRGDGDGAVAGGRDGWRGWGWRVEGRWA
jgi:hypothetical protein